MFTKLRRDRAVNQAITAGKKLREVEAARQTVDGSYEHTAVDAAYLDQKIDTLTRKRDRALDYIRKTA